MNQFKLTQKIYQTLHKYGKLTGTQDKPAENDKMCMQEIRGLIEE